MVHVASGNGYHSTPSVLRQYRFSWLTQKRLNGLDPGVVALIYVLIILWTCIVLLGAKLTRLKTQFWVSMSLVALSNLLSVIIMLKYTHIDSAGWYLARGLECLSAMAVMIRAHV